MSVRVYKARHHNASVRIEGGFIGIGSAKFGGCSDRDNLFIADNDRAIFNDAKHAEGVTALRSAREGEELGGGVDEHGNSRV
jgi:hypothetical protein